MHGDLLCLGSMGSATAQRRTFSATILLHQLRPPSLTVWEVLIKVLVVTLLGKYILPTDSLTGGQKTTIDHAENTNPKVAKTIAMIPCLLLKFGNVLRSMKISFVQIAKTTWSRLITVKLLKIYKGIWMFAKFGRGTPTLTKFHISRPFSSQRLNWLFSRTGWSCRDIGVLMSEQGGKTTT